MRASSLHFIVAAVLSSLVPIPLSRAVMMCCRLLTTGTVLFLCWIGGPDNTIGHNYSFGREIGESNQLLSEVTNPNNSCM